MYRPSDVDPTEVGRCCNPRKTSVATYRAGMASPQPSAATGINSSAWPGCTRSSPMRSNFALRSSVNTHARRKPSHMSISSGMIRASTTRHPPRGRSTLPDARATSRYRTYNEPHPQITVDQPAPPPPFGLKRGGNWVSLDRPKAVSSGGNIPDEARKTRYTAQIKSGKLSAIPVRSRSGVKAARLPCSRASSIFARDLVRRISSVFAPVRSIAQKSKGLATRPGEHRKSDESRYKTPRAPDPSRSLAHQRVHGLGCRSIASASPEGRQKQRRSPGARQD